MEKQQHPETSVKIETSGEGNCYARSSPAYIGRGGAVKLQYLNGEKVYVSKVSFMGPPDEYGDTFYNGLRIIRHRDVVRVLNRVFQEAKENEDIDMDLFSVITGLEYYTKNKPLGLKSEIVAEKTVTFDDAGKIRLAKDPRLHAEMKINPEWAGKPYIIKGGQHKPMVPRKNDDTLKDEFRSFLSSGCEAAR